MRVIRFVVCLVALLIFPNPLLAQSVSLVRWANWDTPVVVSAAPVLAEPMMMFQANVANPTTLEFNPSSDHNATYPVSGLPIVASYNAIYFPAAQCNPTCPATGGTTIPLGKPVPVAGKITVTGIFGGLTQNTLYKLVVIVTGSGGTSAHSNVSDPFGNEVLRAPAPVSGTVVKQ